MIDDIYYFIVGDTNWRRTPPIIINYFIFIVEKKNIAKGLPEKSWTGYIEF